MNTLARGNIAENIAYAFLSIFIAPFGITPVMMVWFSFQGIDASAAIGIGFAWIVAAIIYVTVGLPVYFLWRFVLGPTSSGIYAIIGALICFLPFAQVDVSALILVLFVGCGAAVAFAGSWFLNVTLDK